MREFKVFIHILSDQVFWSAKIRLASTAGDFICGGFFGVQVPVLFLGNINLITHLGNVYSLVFGPYCSMF